MSSNVSYVNASPPRSLNVATLATLQVHKSHDVEGSGQHFVQG